MANPKKKCSCGCGKNSIKEGLAWGCYSKKFGKPPYGPKKENGKAKRSEAGLKHAKSNGHACDGCQEYRRIEAVMIAAGLVTREKFEQARKIVEELNS